MKYSQTLMMMALATLTAAGVPAQTPDPAAPAGTLQAQPAPIVRNAPSPAYPSPTYGGPGYGQRMPQPAPVFHTQPAPGVVVRTDKAGVVTTVTADAKRTELKLDHGRATVSVHDPAADSLVLVDLPGGQTQLLKNGVYTFNADTNTVRTLHGEADAFAADGKPIAVKEDHELVFAGAQTHARYSDPYLARKDYVPGDQAPYGYATEPRQSYGYGPYGDGFYGYPYYAYGSPYWGWGYPFGLGFGWGWGGGFYGGGYGGFRGGGFRGRR